MNQITSPVISRRQKTAGPNHHLWNNHGTWWINYTVHLPNHTKDRRSQNLRTADLETARLLRDRFFREKSKPLPPDSNLTSTQRKP